MIYEIAYNFPNDIIYESDGPFISLYQPTFRYRPDNKQDIIRFKNLVQSIYNSLLQKYDKKEVNKLLEPFYVIGEDRLFWNNSKDGLGILSNKNKTVVYKLSRPVEELAIVSDSFHIKPLLRTFQSASRYHLLGIGKTNFVIYEGDRYGFNKVELDNNIPKTIEEVLGDQYTRPYLNPGSYGGAGDTPMFHGHGSRKDEVEKDTEKYFRYIDKLMLDKFSNVEKIPLILVALSEHQGLFRSISNNPYLLSDGITKDYEILTVEDAKKDAWTIIQPYYLNKTKKIIERFKLERSKFLGSDDLTEVVRAAFENRIDTLLVEADRILPGKINKDTGELIKGNAENPDFDDILDDLAEMVFKTSGNVLVLPKERMPSTTGIAAIYKF